MSRTTCKNPTYCAKWAHIVANLNRKSQLQQVNHSTTKRKKKEQIEERKIERILKSNFIVAYTSEFKMCKQKSTEKNPMEKKLLY